MMKKPSLNFQTFALALSVGLAMSSSMPAGAGIKNTTLSLGSPTGSETLVALNGSRLKFKVQGMRNSRERLGGPRCGAKSCAGEQMTVTALLPKTNEKALVEKKQIEIESTVSARPTFFVYMTKAPVKKTEFIVTDEKGEDLVVGQQIALTRTPGIVSLSIPADAKPLEVGQLYHWYFTVVCDSNGDRSGDMPIEGWVKRIEPDPTLAAQLKNASPSDRAELYTNAGIWTDALSTIADLRKNNPNDPQVQLDWTSLLESVSLSTVAQANIIGSLNGSNSQ